MAYQLGIDLGTTYTAAAVHRDGNVEVVTLGNRSASVPSVIFLKDDESFLTGDAASRRGVAEPERLAREFKRRVGDPAPVLLGDTPYSAEGLMAKLLRWTHDTVSELQGGPPERVAVTHPANWGPYKKDLLDQAVRLADLDGVTTLTEPEAAAIYYASQERVEPGSVIAVYDLGGGTFDAAVLRKHDHGWEVLGSPEGIERLGGIDFDEAVFSHVRRSLAEEFAALDPDDAAVIEAVARLRQDCVEAKEALSSDTDVSISVILPNVSTKVRLTRAEFEAMIRPTLQETIGALGRALRSADVQPDDVSAVLLVGGSSRIPLVAQLVSAELGRPVAVDAHPKHAIALGAALAAASAEAPAEQGAVAVDAGSEPETPAAGAAPATTVAHAVTAPGEPEQAGAGDEASSDSPQQPAEPSRAPGRKVPVGLLAAVGAGLVAVIAAVAMLGGGGGSGDGDGSDGQPAAATETTTPPETNDDQAPGGTADPEPAGPAARITSITVQDGRYVVEYDSFGFTPQINNPGAYHVHFFWDTLPVINAGTNGPDPGQWLLWDTPFTVSDAFFDVSARPEGARRICVVVVDNAHAVADVDNDGAVDTDTGHCADLPEG